MIQSKTVISFHFIKLNLHTFFKTIQTLLIILFSLFLFHCSSTEKDQTTAEGLFAYAQEFDEAERYEVALQKYADVKNKFPYHKLATEAELAIADVHFKRESYTEAELSYQNFRELHPKHPKSDYVLFKIAMSFYKQLPETIDRDLSQGDEAIYHFDELIKLYPNSEYANESKKNKDEVLSKLAQKELYIADFYLKQEIYSSALRRYEGLIKKFPSIGFDPNAHYGAILSARGLDDKASEKKHTDELLKTYPKSEQAAKLKNKETE